MILVPFFSPQTLLASILSMGYASSVCDIHVIVAKQGAKMRTEAKC